MTKDRPRSKRAAAERPDFNAIALEMHKEFRAGSKRFALIENTPDGRKDVQWGAGYVNALSSSYEGGSRKSLIDLLRSGAPLHPMLLPLLAEVIAVKSHKRGRPPALPEHEADRMAWFVKYHMTRDHSGGAGGLRGMPPPTVASLVRSLASHHNVSEATVRRHIRGWRKVKVER